jgi:hypothetical protein
MAIWQLHYAFINDDVRVQFYFIRVLKLTSFGGFTTFYNFIRVSSNNSIKMSDVFCTSCAHTHNRDHAFSAFYAVWETWAKCGLHAGETKFNTQREKLASMGLCITICTILSVNFIYTSCAIKTQATGNNRNSHTKRTLTFFVQVISGSLPEDDIHITHRNM